MSAQPETFRANGAYRAPPASVVAAPSEPAEVAQAEAYRAKGAYRAVGVAVSPAEPEHPELGQEALHGLAGDVVRVIAPETEADPVAILAHFHVMFGDCVGRTPNVKVGAALHTTNLNVVCVGTSSKGRKGTAAEAIKPLFRSVDELWTRDRVQAGLSSGEGLIWAVRDPIHKKEAVREGKGRAKKVVGYIDVLADEGVTDKRLLLLETEFAGVLRVLDRDGNTLSAIIRQAWDSGTLRTLTKNSPALATDAHIAIVGHVTQDELLRYLDRTESANGFGNRFLWFLVKRSQLLPEGGDLSDAKLVDLRRDVANALEFGRTVGELRRNDAARDRWASIYGELAVGRSGLAGALTSRAEAQTLRLSMIYAILDRSREITVAHLEAALAVWRYVEDSVELIFGDSLGDPMADEILRGLRGSPSGLTRDEIRELFQRHKSSEQIGRALAVLLRAGLANMVVEPTSGRSAERWFAVPRAARKARYAREVMREPGEEG